MFPIVIAGIYSTEGGRDAFSTTRSNAYIATSPKLSLTLHMTLLAAFPFPIFPPVRTKHRFSDAPSPPNLHNPRPLGRLELLQDPRTHARSFHVDTLYHDSWALGTG